MRAVLLRKIHINKTTLGGAQAPSIPAHSAVPGSVPGRGNLLVCTLTLGDGPWQHLAPNQVSGHGSAGMDQPGLEREAQQCWPGLCWASWPHCPGSHSLSMHWQSPAAHRVCSLGAPAASHSGVLSSPMHGPWTAEPAPWYVVPTS